MRTITIRVRAVDFAEWMTAMRVWLDQHQFEPSKFKYAEDGDELTTPTVERAVSIGQAGEISIDDLGSQLRNSHC